MNKTLIARITLIVALVAAAWTTPAGAAAQRCNHARHNKHCPPRLVVTNMCTTPTGRPCVIRK